jgi:hypothetical protein
MLGQDQSPIIGKDNVGFQIAGRIIAVMVSSCGENDLGFSSMIYYGVL